MKSRFVYKKIFHNTPGLMQEMLDLRASGWSSLLLARKYNCDHSTILYHCKKNNVKPKKGNKTAFEMSKIKIEICEIKESKPWLPAYKKIGNPGHNYNWYIKQEQLRCRTKAQKLLDDFRK